jgi:hypothetical protein
MPEASLERLFFLSTSRHFGVLHLHHHPSTRHIHRISRTGSYVSRFLKRCGRSGSKTSLKTIVAFPPALQARLLPPQESYQC